MFKTEVGEFKGNKTFSITSGDRRIISFGLNKAKAIVACIDEIIKFSKSSSSESTSLESLPEDKIKSILQFLGK